MSLLVVGSIALDTLETPLGKKRDIAGGSAVYFSYSASLFCPVRLVGVIGNDFPEQELEFLKARKINLEGLQVEKGKTFCWHGRYVGDMCAAETISVDLNTFGTFNPVIPKSYQDSKYLFLANGSPVLQMKVMSQMKRQKLVIADTMNLWIEREKKALLKLIQKIDGLILNNDELKQLTGMYHVVAASREILKWGPKLLIIKKGEHGALLITKKDFFAIPGYPVETVCDPTGAGDSFAGGMMGYLAKTDDISIRNIKKSLLYGNSVASFTIEDFGLERLKRLSYAQLQKRYNDMKAMISV
ncbi:MAG: sugar kinase [Planctomycetes bacterium]|nr:sugar kinase [Planctomycetota bacterium]